MQEVLTDGDSASLPSKERAILKIVDSVNRNAAAIAQSDIDLARSAGCSDEEIYDAVTVCALFQFFNTWTDAMGVRAMPAEFYEQAGQRVASQGYDPTASS